jgi:predicted flap endonuclease-1-like 5' DNA nuclease
MRRVYLLIIVFLVACIVFAEIYIHQIKGKGAFQESGISGALWILEWLFMLVVACIIGIAIGWHLRTQTIAQHLEQIDQLEEQKRSLLIKVNHSEEQANQSQMKLSRAQESFREDFKTLSAEKERAKETIVSMQTQAQNLKDEITRLQIKLDHQERELKLSLDSNLLLKSDLEKAKTENENLSGKLENKSFVLPPKDDLKLIAGIGPAIEKKLNGLGIYSFRQISEFTPKTIDEISTAIRFFPGRIERDNWVSQAKNFEAEKRRQA